MLALATIWDIKRTCDEKQIRCNKTYFSFEAILYKWIYQKISGDYNKILPLFISPKS